MRRQGVVPVVDWLRARGSPDGPEFGAGHTLLDLATGTGAMLEAVGQAAPGLDLHGLPRCLATAACPHASPHAHPGQGAADAADREGGRADEDPLNDRLSVSEAWDR